MFNGHRTLTEVSELAAPARFPATPATTPIGAQAVEIITSILEDASPGLAEVKLRLRRCLADHPGRPEQALLAHLMETSSQVNAEGGEEPR